MKSFPILFIAPFLACCSKEDRFAAIDKIKKPAPAVTAMDTVYIGMSAGQSNMDGRAKESYPYSETVEGVKIFDWPTRTLKTFNYSKSNGSEVSSRKMWAADHIVWKKIYDSTYKGSREVIALKCAKGGTSLNPTGSSAGSWATDRVPAGIPKMYDSLKIRFNDFKKLYPGKFVKVEYLLWHQGESDQKFTVGYYGRLKRLFDSVRVVTGNPDLVVVIGTVSGSSKYYSKSIREQTLSLAANYPKLYRIVDLYDVPVGPDVAHFTDKGQTEFATRAYRVIKSLIKP